MGETVQKAVEERKAGHAARASGGGESAAAMKASEKEASAADPVAQLSRRLNGSPRVASLARLDRSLAAGRGAPVQRRTERGGMPPELRAGLEAMSGMDLSGTRVHYDSPEPAQLNAHAFARGQDIHLAPGQEGHLPHEAGHVVQQMQGRVRATTEVAGVGVNDDPGLEREADRLGQRALQVGGAAQRVAQRKARAAGRGEAGRGQAAAQLRADAAAPSATRPAGSTGAVAQLGKKDHRNRKGGKRKNKPGTSFEETVLGMSPDLFIDSDFAANHIRRYSKLRGETAAGFAIAEGKRRGLGKQTVVFMEPEQRKALGREALEGNASKAYLKRIKKNGGVPAATFFVSDGLYHYVTVAPDVNGDYEVDTEAVGRIEYTVKNVGTLDKVPLFKINHLESMVPVQEIDDLGPDSEEELQEEAELSEEELFEEESFEEEELHEDLFDDEDFGFGTTQLAATPASTAAQAPPVVQRVIQVGGKDFDAEGALNLLFSQGKVKDLELANALEGALEILDERDFSAGNADELLEAALKVLDEEDDDSDTDEVDFPLDLWNGENPKLKETNLKEAGYVHGPSLRAEQGMDYETVDKEAFSVQGKGKENLALVVRLNRPKGAGTLTQEISTLRGLGKTGMPTAKIRGYGYYPKGGVAHPALLMDRYESSSKTLLRRVKKKTQRVENWKANAAKVFDEPSKVEAGIESLQEIESLLLKNASLAVDDIQFLIRSDGRFVINDASETGSKYRPANLEVIDDLKTLLEEWGQELEKLQDEDSEGGGETSFLLPPGMDPENQPGWIDLGNGNFLPDFRSVGGIGFPEE